METVLLYCRRQRGKGKGGVNPRLLDFETFLTAQVRGPLSLMLLLLLRSDCTSPSAAAAAAAVAVP